MKFILGVLLLIILFVFLFIEGIFHPKEIYIDDIRIQAPKHMILSSVTVDYKNTQDYISPLLLKNNNRYNLNKHKIIHFEFSKVSGFYKSLPISITLKTNANLEKYIKKYTNNKYKESSDKKCYIYKYDDDDIFHTNIFHKIKKLEINLLSFKEYISDEILQQFCKK